MLFWGIEMGNFMEQLVLGIGSFLYGYCSIKSEMSFNSLNVQAPATIRLTFWMEQRTQEIS